MHQQQDLPVLTIDGARFDDFEGFTREFSALLSDYTWRGNLDAFNDILRGGFGTPDAGFVLRWSDSARSREVLGWDAMAGLLERILGTCHPTNRASVRERLAAAHRGEGPTLFDTIVEIIEVHGPGGEEPEGNVLLELA